MSRRLAALAVALTASLASAASGSPRPTRTPSADRGYNTRHPRYGFVGDPLRPFGDGRYYGFLVRAGL